MLATFFCVILACVAASADVPSVSPHQAETQATPDAEAQIQAFMKEALDSCELKKQEAFVAKLLFQASETRFCDEGTLRANQTQERVQAEAEEHIKQVITDHKNPETVTCITQVMTESQRVIGVTRDKLCLDLKTTNGKSSGEVDRVLKEFDLVVSAVPGMFAKPQAELEACSDETCVNSKIENAKSQKEKVKLMVGKIAERTVTHRRNFEDEAMKHRQRGKKDMESVQAKAVQKMKKCMRWSWFLPAYYFFAGF